MFSRACEYALRAVLYISAKTTKGSRLGMAEIAKEIDAPLAFTAKILQTLVREEIISSIKGPNGGFFLRADSKPVTLGAIVMAIDGTDVLHTCTLGLKECTDKFPCPLHDDIKSYKERLRVIIRETTVQELTEDLIKGKTFLKNLRSRKKV